MDMTELTGSQRLPSAIGSRHLTEEEVVKGHLVNKAVFASMITLGHHLNITLMEEKLVLTKLYFFHRTFLPIFFS